MPEKDTKQTERSKTSIGEKRPHTTDTRSSPRTKRKSSILTFHMVLMENDFEGIADRVYGIMTKPLTAITTVQEVLKKTIEIELTELKMLMSHTSQVATPSTTPSVVIDQEGNHHRFIEVTPISIRRLAAQEGVQEGLQEGAV